MKKWIALMMVLVIGFAVMPAKVYAADQGGDTIVDKVSDWFATMGKSGNDKDVILFQRRTERASKRLGNAMNAEGKKLNKEMGKMFDSK